MSVRDHRDAARALLSAGIGQTVILKPREGQFLGGIAFDANPLSEKQQAWLDILLGKLPFDDAKCLEAGQ